MCEENSRAIVQKSIGSARLSGLTLLAALSVFLISSCSSSQGGETAAAAEPAPPDAAEPAPLEAAERVAPPAAAPAPPDLPSPRDASLEEADPPAAVRKPEPAADPQPAARPFGVAVSIRDQGERMAVEGLLRDAPNLEVAPGPFDADAEVSDQPLPQGSSYILAAWVAVTDQRHTVLDLSLADLRRVLAGAVTDWFELGGRAQPVIAFVPCDDADAIAAALALPDLGPNIRRASLETIQRSVASGSGALAVLPPTALCPGLLPLVLDGHDPLRDPSADTPMRLERWIRGRTTHDEERVATILGWTDRAPNTNPVGLLATGDFIPTRCTNEAVETFADGDYAAIFERTRAALQAADLTLLSMEIGLTDRGEPTPCVGVTDRFNLQGKLGVIGALKAAGIDVVTTAGNHAGDCWTACGWKETVLDTIAGLEDAEIAHAGTGANLAAARAPTVVERDGVRIAFLSYDDIAPRYFAKEESAGTAPLDLETLAEDVAAAKEMADHVVVAFSWGTEYTVKTTARQREAVAVAVDAGASLIVGNHPHWTQPVEVLQGALATYALGNFVFDQDWSIATTQSVILEVGFDDARVLGYRLRPVVVRDNYRPEFVDPAGEEGATILRRVWDGTDALPLRESERP